MYAIRSKNFLYRSIYVVLAFSCNFKPRLTYTLNMQSHNLLVDMLLNIFMRLLAFNLIGFKSKIKPQQ